MEEEEEEEEEKKEGEEEENERGRSAVRRWQRARRGPVTLTRAKLHSYGGYKSGYYRAMR